MPPRPIPTRDTAFAKRVRDLRMGRGWTQRDLGVAAGIGKRSIEEYERGQVPKQNLVKLAEALGVTEHYLLHGEETLDVKVDMLVEEVRTLHRRIRHAEELSTRESAALRRILLTNDQVMRALAVHLLNQQTYDQLPDAPSLGVEPGNGDGGSSTTQESPRSA